MSWQANLIGGYGNCFQAILISQVMIQALRPQELVVVRVSVLVGLPVVGGATTAADVTVAATGVAVVEAVGVVVVMVVVVGVIAAGVEVVVVVVPVVVAAGVEVELVVVGVVTGAAEALAVVILVSVVVIVVGERMTG